MSLVDNEIPSTKDVSTNETAQVRRCLAELQESSDRRVQLDQLLHFLEGANANQARDIGSDTAFYSVLVALLESADPSSSEVLKVLDLLDLSFTTSRDNQSMFVKKVSSGTKTLITLLSNVELSWSSLANELGLVRLVGDVIRGITSFSYNAYEQFAVGNGARCLIDVWGRIERLHKTLPSPAKKLCIRRFHHVVAAIARLTSALCRPDSLIVEELRRSSVPATVLALSECCCRALVASKNGDDTFATSTRHVVDTLCRLSAMNESILVLPEASLKLFLQAAQSTRESSATRCVHLQLMTLLGYVCERDDDAQHRVFQHWEATNGRHYLAEHLHMFSTVVSACNEIWLNSWDEDTVSGALASLADSLRSASSAPYAEMVAFVPNVLPLLLQCVRNIDEEIMHNALSAVYYVVLASHDGLRYFLELGGVSALIDALHDYNPSIRVTSLEILCILAAEQPLCRDDLQHLGILSYVLKLMGLFGQDEDISLEIVEAGAGLLGHALTDKPSNQDYLCAQGGIQTLIKALNDCCCDENADGTLPLSTCEAILLALNNLLYQNSTCQLMFARCGGFELIEKLWCLPSYSGAAMSADPGALDTFDQSRNVDALDTLLNVCVNAVDSCSENQQRCSSSTWQARVNALLVSRDSSLASLGCLLLSHLTSRHPENQMRYTTRQTTESLLRLISTGSKKVDAVHSQTEFHICSYALMALTTLSYENQALQNFLAELDGLSTLLVPLQSDCSDIRQHAISCLGNAVKNHKANAVAVTELGVVDFFISLLSDDEENDVSKMAFQTLVQMESVALEHILAIIKRVVRASVPGGPEGDSDIDIEPYFTALNGIIYTSPSMSEFVLESDGLAALLEVLASPALCSLGGYVVFVLVNLTVSRSKRVQKLARDRGVFEALEGFMKWLDYADEGIMGAFSPNETRQVVYQLLDNLLTANASNAMHFLQQSHLIEALSKDLGGIDDDNNDGSAVFPDAAEVLVTLCEFEQVRLFLAPRGAEKLLCNVHKHTESEVVRAKASQAREHLHHA